MRGFLLASILFLTFYACGNRSTRTAKTDGLTFDSVVVDTMAALTTDSNSPKCTVKLNIQYAKGQNAQKINQALLRSGLLAPDYFSLTRKPMEIKAAVDSFARRLLTDYHQDYGSLYRQDREHASVYEYAYNVQTDTRNGIDNIVVYTARIYTYAGGTHGISQTLIRNIDTRTGNLLRLSDVFVPGYEPTLKEILLQKIQERFKAKSLEDLVKQSVFTDGDVYVPENFALDEDEISFVFCQDEIAPHAMGEIVVGISRSELKGILK